MKLSFFGKTDVGKVRHTNEDYFTNEKIDEKEYLFIIADGMGGHQAGEVASKLGTTTFVNEYKKLRNKGKTIKDAMTLSLKKANSNILKRAISDPQKRGMGTTFTGCVISDKKASIIHVGDSRIYFIRNNKIKKITTDHTFVEKMLNEGKITEEEAKDHPQKNILYMSLGARETYVPEIIDNLDIKNGDIITMCSDGLNNMVDDGLIKEYSLAYDPERSVKELIRLANDNGGIDNITIQVIHAGKLINKNKTQPLKKIKTKRKKIALIFSIGFLFILFFIWIGRNGSFSKPVRENNPNSKNIYPFQSVILKQKYSLFNNKILKLKFFRDQKKTLIPQNFFFLSRGELFIKKKYNFYLLNINNFKSVKEIPLKPDEQIIPFNQHTFPRSEKTKTAKETKRYPEKTNLNSFYILKKVKSKSLQYKIIDPRGNKALLTIQSDEELNSINHESRMIKFTGMKSSITPIYMDNRAFIFNDKQNYYVIERPLSGNMEDLGFYKISDFKHHQDIILSIKATEDSIKISHFDCSTKTLKVFDITKSKLISSQKVWVPLPEKPLSIEYYNQNTNIFYFSTHFLIIWKGYQVTQSFYNYREENLLVRSVVIDSTVNQRIISDKNRVIYKLNLIHND